MKSSLHGTSPSQINQFGWQVLLPAWRFHRASRCMKYNHAWLATPNLLLCREGAALWPFLLAEHSQYWIHLGPNLVWNRTLQLVFRATYLAPQILALAHQPLTVMRISLRLRER